ncbi:hypothetical protein [Aureimonas sp. SK2]|uniref:hypothetical protein n=1 Tax=Aureimonas sp. SK2 TaxID=3015992 RepID=UPI002443E68E|nr:hypothetical protein [Aureimonas sp. SK2]
MVHDPTFEVTSDDPAVRDAVRTHFYAVQTVHAETTNPMAAFVGNDEAPSHVLSVGGHLHSVRVGWSKQEFEKVLRDEVLNVLGAPELVNTPAFARMDVKAIRLAVVLATREGDELDALPLLTPTLAAEVRRLAGCYVWNQWAHDYVQTELRKGLAASMTALGPDPQPMSPWDIEEVALATRAFR